ncbi:MAG: WecB/TagA/CpsF family glycosyltransferase [Alphaproteobacteria bacterium]|nr:WecB/TagA/CpsF family glycosyltransferase [Alphaproteobacteria bacterium]
MTAQGIVMPSRFLQIGGIQIAVADRRQLARMMVNHWRRNVAAGRSDPPKLLFSANGQSIAMYGTDPDFRAAIGEADLIHADGMSLVLMSRLLFKRPLPERVATTDFFHDVAQEAESSGMSFYLLGAQEDINRAAFEAVGYRYPSLKLAGRRHGYFRPEEEAGVIEEIRSAQPDVVWVALGRPRQEYFCVRNRAHLTGVSWVKTCGGLFDFLAGKATRAPMWMQTAGLEWLYRTALEPRRLAWRYLTTNPYALWRMLLHSRELGITNEQAGQSGRT